MGTLYAAPLGWLLAAVDDVDELYSDLIGSPSALVVTRDRRVWEVWVDLEDERFSLRRLDGPGVDRREEPATFEEAFQYLGGGYVVYMP